ncbi:hypothetical protein ACFYTF_10165 [Nocardia thailandica]|uniref:Uncharacterized protein n=1 Tax=Nocardia thailandica TaxID=257275 RepID=A0ABW6PLA6_9NOCA
MTAVPLKVPALLPPWSSAAPTHGTTTVSLTAQNRDGRTAHIQLQRCTVGRLRYAYPTGEHDIEIQITQGENAPLSADLISAVVAAIEAAEPRCRRIVLPVPVAALDDIAAAEQAGLRPVVEVDLPDAELVLLVVEPAWVRGEGGNADQVPGT